MGGYYLAVAATAMMPLWGAYIAAAAALPFIVVHEACLPERAEWRPSRGEAATDLVFLVLVQMLLPQFLSLLAAILFAQIVAQNQWLAFGLWPHQWPIAGQFLLLTIIAEFPRYWLHRFMHTVGPLWRFHAVHHAPRILYWLNVGRFHPIDKGLQFLVETLPFMVLGVSPEVLGLYFVFYAVTGFYQHSNCRVRLGFLNWIVAGPELHRWHHSLSPRESNSNYGNKLILWDTIFGTRFLPETERLVALGIPDMSYPTGFLSQISAPFQQRPRV